MASNKLKDATMVQTYDRTEIRHYIKIIPFLFWTSERIVRSDRLKDERILEIKTIGEDFDIILYNGRKVKLVDVVEEITN